MQLVIRFVAATLAHNKLVTWLLFTSLYLLARRLAYFTLASIWRHGASPKHAAIICQTTGHCPRPSACIAMKKRPGRAHFYTPVSTSLAVLSSIFLSILLHSSRRSMCVATATEQQQQRGEGEALSAPSGGTHRCRNTTQQGLGRAEINSDKFSCLSMCTA